MEPQTVIPVMFDVVNIYYQISFLFGFVVGVAVPAFVVWRCGAL